MPLRNDKQLTRQDILSVLRKIDQGLEGLQRKVRLYCVGGTYLVLSREEDSSKDIDFIVSYQDFKILSGPVVDVEQKDKVRFDLFPDGEMPSFRLPDYDLKARRLPFSFNNLEVYMLDLVDMVLTKAIAGRAEDYEDIDKLVNDKSILPKEKLVQRFKELKIAKDREKEVKKKFYKFVEEFYR